MNPNKVNYKIKPIERLRADYSRRKQKNSFENYESFEDWYKCQGKVCYYCGLTEEESQEIVLNNILTSNRFPQQGKFGRGQSRGVWLEVDRIKPKENYSPDNCVLACYFCNNDKSDVFDGNDYKEFMNDRVGYLRQLLKRKNDS